MTMAKQDTSTAVPRLRLAEFRNDQGWASWSLGELVEFSSGGTPSKADPSYWSGDIPWISASSMCEANIAESDLKVTSRAIGNGARIASKGSILVLVRGSMLFNRVPIGIAIVDVAFNQDVKALKIARGINARFLLNQLIAISPRIPINETGIGAGKIETDTLANFLVYLPSEAEQQKIADCLTSLDEVIAAQGRKVEALKAHKRGLMQQLFPREGETRPRLRFPEFRDGPEWSAIPLGELAVIVRGGSPRPIDMFLTRKIDGLNWLKIGDVDREAKYITKTEEKVRPEALSKTRVINAGDFILSNSMSFGRPYISTIETCIHDGWIAVTDIPDRLNREFLYYSILSDKSQRYFANQAAGSGVQNLNKDIIKLLPLEIPSKGEQQRIADCLSSLDTQITAESRQLAALKTHKLGLMQQLFPASQATSA